MRGLFADAMLRRVQPFELGSCLSADDAAAILTWHYPPPYDVYDPVHDGADAYLDPAYRAVRTESDGLIGFFCAGPDGQVPGGRYDDDALDLGMGLRPDWTGRGRGAQVIGSVVSYLQAESRARAFRVTIAGFNTRAIRACERAGFRAVERFAATRDGREFVVLRLGLAG